MNLELFNNVVTIENKDIEKVLKLYILKQIESAKFIDSKVDEDSIKLEIQKLQILEWKDKLIFHGGCLSCSTPYHETISCCLSCEYCRGFGGGFEDKSEKYKDV